MGALLRLLSADEDADSGGEDTDGPIDQAAHGGSEVEVPTAEQDDLEISDDCAPDADAAGAAPPARR